MLLSDSPLKSAINGWGMSVTHSSQCLYIRSSMTRPVALGRSGYMSCAVRAYFMPEKKTTCFSSGEKRKPSIPFSTSLINLRSEPSAFIIHNWFLSFSGYRKAIFFPPSIHTALLSDFSERVMRWPFFPSMFIT